MSRHNLTKLLLIFSSVILFVFSSAYFLFISNSRVSNNQSYDQDNLLDRNFTTIIQKELFSENTLKNNGELFSKDKITINFTAKIDDLGIISIPFNSHNKSVDDRIIFRLKKTGENGWYFQGEYDANQFRTGIPFPFGFPTINKSRGNSYTFQIESLNGRQGNSVSLSKSYNYFLADYVFTKSELFKNIPMAAEFIVAKVYSRLPFLTIKDILMIFLVSLLPLVFYFNGRISWLRKKSKINIDENIFKDFLKAFSMIAIIVIIANYFLFPLYGLRKWIPYLSLLVPSIAIGFNLLNFKFLKNKFALLAAIIVFLIVSVHGVLNYRDPLWFGIFGLFISYLYLLIFPLKEYKYLYLLSIGMFIFLFNINSVFFINSYGGINYWWIALLSVFLIFTFFYLFFKNDLISWNKINKIAFVFLLIVSLILSFRSDPLFTNSAEYHWSYFVGVIQTVRSGGELLWSAPSQYGFLNILIPSFFPWTSINSFYIFQSILFFIYAFILIKIIFLNFKNSVVFIPFSLIGISLLFFADPTLVGSLSLPSTSVVRFFCIYILIYVIYCQYRKGDILNGRTKWIITATYVAGSLWSAESFLYCTAVYFTYLFVFAISLSKLSAGIKQAIKYLLTNILLVFVSFIVFNLFYLIFTHHFPDWSMYFMYVFGYGSGFGEYMVPLWEIYWAVIISLSGIIFVFSRLYSAKKYSESVMFAVCFSALWILTSYYIGRATASNITNLLPETFLLFVIMLSTLNNLKSFSYKLILVTIFLPWVLVGVMGGIGNPEFIQKLPEFRFAEKIDSKSMKIDKQLYDIVGDLKVSKKTNNIYYWSTSANPVFLDMYGKYVDLSVGMPEPLALLEETTIASNKRRIILERFLGKINLPAFFVYRKDINLMRLSEWKSLLVSKFFLKEMETLERGVYGVVFVK